MPELPEVETIKNDLLGKIVGRSFLGVTLTWPKAVRQPSPEEFKQRLKGQTVDGLMRRGKYLVFHLGSGEALILHFKMSGSLLWKPAPEEPAPDTRSIFHLDDGTELHFRDRRKLGAMWLVEDKDEVIGNLGPEPLDSGFTPRALAERLSQRSAPIKAVLLDQTSLAGVGNMYADEALFAARIHPLKRANSLSTEEVAKLHHALRQVLLSAIDNKGASTDTYVRPSGQPGAAQSAFQVAHRGGQPCPACGTPIERIPLRNRGTYLCPNCQRN